MGAERVLHKLGNWLYIYAMMCANRETQTSSCMDCRGHFQAGLVAEFTILSTTEQQQ